MTLITDSGQAHGLDVDENTPLLWALRDHSGLMEIKYSCGIGECVACTVLLDGEARAVRPADAGECIRAAGDHHFG